jgi:hypothetical protein
MLLPRLWAPADCRARCSERCAACGRYEKCEKKGVKNLAAMDNSSNNSLLHAPIGQNWMYLLANNSFNSFNVAHNPIPNHVSVVSAATKKPIKPPSNKK